MIVYNCIIHLVTCSWKNGMNATFNSKFQLLSSSPAKAPSFTHRFSPSWGPPLSWAPVVLLHPEDRPGSLRRDRGSWPSQGSLNRNRWMSPAGFLHFLLATWQSTVSCYGDMGSWVGQATICTPKMVAVSHSKWSTIMDIWWICGTPFRNHGPWP